MEQTRSRNILERNTSRDWLVKHGQFLLLAAASITVAVFFWILTPYGISVGHDSLFYIDAATNLVEGNGYYWTGSGGELKPLSHFPPGYPALLALPLSIGMEKIQATRLIAAFMTGANYFAISFILYRFSKNVFLSLPVSLAILSTPVLVEQYFSAMSESMFFFLMLLGLYGVVEYSANRKKSMLVIAACSIAIAPLTRYIGTSLLLASVLGLFFYVEGNFKQKLIHSAVFGLLTGLPLSLWIFRNWRLTGTSTNRTFLVHLVDVDTLKSLLIVIFNWVPVGFFSRWVESILLIAFVVGVFSYSLWRIFRRPEHQNRIYKLVVLLMVFVGIYLAQLMVSLSFFDASTRINNRILSPVYLSFALIIFLMANSTDRRKTNMWLTVGLLAFLLPLPYPRMLDQSIGTISSVQDEGAGFASTGWRESELISFIQTRESNPVIISNQAMAVHFLTENPAIQVPERWDPVKDQERTDYQSELDLVLSKSSLPNAYVVLFRQSDLSIERDYGWLENFTLVLETDNGWIYTQQDPG